MKSKKGFQSQFTWMFIIIAGAIILTFFTTIGYKQRAISEQKVSIELEQHLNNIISSALQSPGSSLPITTPRAGVSFSCTTTCDCQLGVGKEKKGTPFNEKIYFAPSYIQGDDMTLWTLDWKTPFRATNLLYIANPRIQYLVVSDGSRESETIATMLQERFPSTITLSFHSISDIALVKDEGYDETRLIFLGTTNPPLHDSFIKQKIYAVQITEGRITFLVKDKDFNSWEQQGTIPIDTTNEAFVTAAIMSADKNMYVCGIQHAYKKLALVAQVFEKRAKLLDKKLAQQQGTTQTCFYDEQHGATQFGHISTAAKTLSINLDDTTALNTLITTSQELNQLNRQKIRFGCPEMY